MTRSGLFRSRSNRRYRASPQGRLILRFTSTHLALARLDPYRRLPPGRICVLAVDRTKRGLIESTPGKSILRVALGRIHVPVGAGWPLGFTPVPQPEPEAFGPAIDLQNVYIHGSPVFDEELRWHAQPTALGQYHSCYLAWVFPLLDKLDPPSRGALLRQVTDSLTATFPLGSGPAWDPYVSATRAWILCQATASLCHAERRMFDRLLWQHLWLLRITKERGLGGNHLLRDIKAIFGLEVWFARGSEAARTLTLFVSELDKQVMVDGGHIERSPSYHAVVLGDAIDVRRLAVAANICLDPLLDVIIKRMAGWMKSLTHSDGSLARFNDSPSLADAFVREIQTSTAESERTLPQISESGFARFDHAGLVLLADFGSPGPPELPGHAHPEALSIEVSTPSGPALRNTGVSTYEAGLVRNWERSTAAHNTVVVDGRSQMRVWGSFRSGPLPVVTSWHEDAKLIGQHDGFASSSAELLHRRSIEPIHNGLRVVDAVVGQGWDVAEASLFVDPSVQLVDQGDGLLLAGDLRISIPSTPYRLEHSFVASEMGMRASTTRIVMEITPDIPSVQFFLSLASCSESGPTAPVAV